VNDVELIQEAAKTARVAFMGAQALTDAAERTLTAIVHVQEQGDRTEELRTAAGALATAGKRAEEAVREAMEDTDRLLDALGADAGTRVVDHGPR
jgi:hypothetical protein